MNLRRRKKMPSSIKKYRNKELARITRNKQRARNYKRGRFYKRSHFKYEDWEIELILTSFETDRVIAKELGRSVQGIQIKRYKEMKGVNYV
jgi:hypothetical protein